jgi:23S rRNA pseudouridine955/2504/2580 synthase/23S rRNA pseudouridine1911/1915/1917 synthase
MENLHKEAGGNNNSPFRGLGGLVVFENDDLIVLNKPSGMLSIPDREGKETSLKKLLLDKYARPDDPVGRGEIFTIHRLDKGTSGLIVFAKNGVAHKYLSQQFENRQAEKIYLGLINGSPANTRGTIDSPIMEHPSKRGLMVVNRKGKESLTDYEVLEDFGIYSWVRFQIHTGRTHQIRIHMKEIGHPIVCDELYGDGKPVLLSSIKHNFKLSKNEEEERPILNRLALHAYKLKFIGADKTGYELEAPIPKDLKATLQQLSKRKSRFMKRNSS